MNYENVIKNIHLGLKDYIISHNIKSLVLGVSGGMDSCLCAALAKPICDELNIPLIGRSIPIESNKQDEIDRANLTGRVFCTDFEQVNLKDVYKSFKGINYNTDPIYHLTDNYMDLSEESKEDIKRWKIRNGNIKARLRMIYLYNLASMNNGIVLSTDNYTEYLLGFWTLHGDVGDLGMIQELYKTEVYDMGEWMAHTELLNEDQKYALLSSIEALATDGLGVTNLGDLGQIMPTWKGSSRDGYKEVDRIIQVWESMKTLGLKQRIIIFDSYEKHPIIQRHLNSEFKRNNPYNLKRNTIIK